MSLLRRKLAAVGIKINLDAAGVYYVDCPQTACKISRRGEDEECLRLNISENNTADWKCSNCLWSDHIGDNVETESIADKVAIKESVVAQDDQGTQLPKQALLYFTQRGITARQDVTWDAEESIIKVHYRQGKKIINNLEILIPEQKTRLSDGAITFYGLDALDSLLPVVVVQRETDRMLLLQSGVHNVISLPNGGLLPKGRDSSEYYSSAIDKFALVKCFKLAFDNNQAGDDLRYEFARRVGAARCENVTHSKGCISDTYLALGADEVCADINDAIPFPITGLYHVVDFQQQLLTHFDGGMDAGVSSGWENVDKYYTVMPCEFTVVTGVPNNGKSEWLDALTLNLALNENWRFGMFSPENGKEQHVVKLVEKRTELSADPKADNRMSRDTFINGAAWVAQHYYFIVGDDENELPSLDWVLEKAAAAILRYGINGLVIDPWNEVEHSRARDMSETDYISAALSKVKRFARNHGIHIWIVAHPNKMHAAKDGKVMVPSLYDISGSAHWANKADNGIVVHRTESIDDGTEIWIKKVRFKHVGKRGMTTLQYNKVSGRFSIPDGSKLAATYSIHNSDNSHETTVYEV